MQLCLYTYRCMWFLYKLLSCHKQSESERWSLPSWAPSPKSVCYEENVDVEENMQSQAKQAMSLLCFIPVFYPHPLARFACDLRNNYFDGGNSYFSHVFENCQDRNCVHVAFFLSPSSPSCIYGLKDLPQMKQFFSVMKWITVITKHCVELS